MSYAILLKDDLIDQFWNQIIKIIEFCKIYDSGNESISQDIACKLKLLFHNTKKRPSLLRQLKMEHIQFSDTCSKYDPLTPGPHSGLTKIHFDNTNPGNVICKQISILKPENIQMVNFENWWTIKKVIIDKFNNSFTRKKLILEMAKTGGETQMAAILNQEYHKLSKLYSTYWIYTDEKGNRYSLNNPAHPSIRQIAHETLITFEMINMTEESKL